MLNAPHKLTGFKINRVLLADPTRTLTLRTTFARDMARRFNELKKAVTESIVKNDCFGLISGAKQPGLQILAVRAAGPDAFAYPTTAGKVEAFMDWLNEQEEKGVLEVIHRPGAARGLEEAWTDIYVKKGYEKGMEFGRVEMNRINKGIAPIEGAFGMQAAFMQPFHADRLGALYTRTFSELKGVTAAMDQQISRVLTEGLMAGNHPSKIARALADRIEKIGITRAKTIARTEIIRAHHAATINEYRNWGVDEVQVQAEWSTAGFNVCTICKPLEGKIYTLDEIEGMIPRHPNCRCAALPYMDPEDQLEWEDQADPTRPSWISPEGARAAKAARAAKKARGPEAPPLPGFATRPKPRPPLVTRPKRPKPRPPLPGFATRPKPKLPRSKAAIAARAAKKAAKPPVVKPSPVPEGMIKEVNGPFVPATTLNAAELDSLKYFTTKPKWDVQGFSDVRKLRLLNEINAEAHRLSRFKALSPKRPALIFQNGDLPKNYTSDSSWLGYTHGRWPAKIKKNPIHISTEARLPIGAGPWPAEKVGAFAPLKSADKIRKGTGNYAGGVYRHEVGHTLQAAAGEEIRKNWTKAMKKISESLIARVVSRYATTNEFEFFAECFEIWAHPNFRPGSLNAALGYPVESILEAAANYTGAPMHESAYFRMIGLGG
jgi:SPP1 gp7 family putative phage head morphogenesis protein